jgi:SAM-dependent methyltransferase
MNQHPVPDPSVGGREPPLIDGERAVYLGHPSYVWRAGQERRLDIVRRHVPLQDRRILDVGCGLGMYTHAFSRYSAHVCGTEVEHQRAAKALSRDTGIVQSVGETLPFPDDTFDVVFSNEVLEHVVDDRQVACEMVRVARPEQHVVLFVPNRLWPLETHGMHWRGHYYFGNMPLINYLPDVLRHQVAWHVRVYTRKTLLALFVDLPVRVALHTTVYPGFDNIVHRFPRLGHAIRAGAYRLEQLPVTERLGLSHFLVLQKT